MFSTIFEHSRVVSSTKKNVRAFDCVSCSKIFLRAGNSPVMLKNSTEHAETLFIALSDNVMFVGDFNSKLQSFCCTKKNASGPMLKNIKKQLNLICLNNDEHTHMHRPKGSTDLLDIAFISPNLAKHDIQFQIGYDLGSDHLPIEISVDAPPHKNSSIDHTKYKFD